LATLSPVLKRSSLLVVPLLVALLACSSSDDAPVPIAAVGGAGGTGGSGASGGSTAPPEWDRPVTPPPDGEAESKRASCGYAKGALPAETLGQSTPTGQEIPIDHILVVMMENRSFDHYFQKAPEKGIPVDVAPADFSNPDPTGKPIKIFRDNVYCIADPAHGWTAVHKQANGGKMDGFVTTNTGDGEKMNCGPLTGLKGDRAMSYYEEEDIPLIYFLARNFSVADRYFCSVLGPTWPNRMYLYGASSFGRTGNDFPENVEATIFDQLEARGVSWKVYRTTTPGFAIMLDTYLKFKDRVVSIDAYHADAAAGTLPQVAFVDPGIAREGYDQSDEHPPAIMEVGQNWIGKVVDSLARSPQWSKSAMFITYDEHGGFYDHVVPPKACPPDDRTNPQANPPVGFDQLGIRVPMMVVSPFARKGYVSHTVFDHTSIVRFIQARFTLPAMSNRDANAAAPFDMFDFAAPPSLTPPTIPVPAIDPAKLAACKELCK
jgi:phospholipase C